MSAEYHYYDRMGNEIDQKSWETLRLNPRYFTVRETDLETESVRITTIWAGRTATEKSDEYMPVIFSTTVAVDGVTQDSYETDSNYLSGGNAGTEPEALIMHERAIELSYEGAFRDRIDNVVGAEKDAAVPESNPCEEVTL